MEVKEIRRNGYTLRIETDDNPSNPRTEWDNLAKMVCFHNRYDLGDEHDYDRNDYNSWAELEAAIIKKDKPIAIRPLYMYDHSGITISTTRFSCSWDSGQIGFIYVPKKNYEKLKDAEKAAKIIELEVEVYDQYLRGDVYGYVIVDENENELDSCWSFYGLDYVIKEGKDVLKSLST